MQLACYKKASVYGSRIGWTLARRIQRVSVLLSVECNSQVYAQKITLHPVLGLESCVLHPRLGLETWVLVLVVVIMSYTFQVVTVYCYWNRNVNRLDIAIVSSVTNSFLIATCFGKMLSKPSHPFRFSIHIYGKYLAVVRLEKSCTSIDKVAYKNICLQLYHSLFAFL